jgi:hypothetical protein
MYTSTTQLKTALILTDLQDTLVKEASWGIEWCLDPNLLDKIELTSVVTSCSISEDDLTEDYISDSKAGNYLVC